MDGFRLASLFLLFLGIIALVIYNCVYNLRVVIEMIDISLSKQFLFLFLKNFKYAFNLIRTEMVSKVTVE